MMISGVPTAEGDMRMPPRDATHTARLRRGAVPISTSPAGFAWRAAADAEHVGATASPGQGSPRALPGGRLSIKSSRCSIRRHFIRRHHRQDRTDGFEPHAIGERRA